MQLRDQSTDYLVSLKGYLTMTHRAQIVTALGIALLTAAGGCSSSASSAGADQLREPTASSEGVANRAIAEADIIELDGDKLYTLSASGAVSVVDVATPSHLALLGQTRLAGEPFEMYRVVTCSSRCGMARLGPPELRLLRCQRPMGVAM
jgi:hypothetical protein